MENTEKNENVDMECHRVDINFENIYYSVPVPKQKGEFIFKFLS